MRKGIMWFPDSLVGKFVFAPAILGAAYTAFLVAFVFPERDPILLAVWWAMGPVMGGTLGLLVFGATVPFVAFWVGMRQAGYGYLRCALNFVVLVAAMYAIWAVVTGIQQAGYAWAINGLFLLGLPWTIADIIRTRKLRTVHTEPSLPEVRR